MVNKSVFKYNVTEKTPENFPEIMETATQFTGGGFPYAIIFLVFIISFFSLASYPNLDTIKASVFMSWITSGFMAVIGIIQPSFVILLSLVLAATTAYSSLQGR